MPRGSAHSDAQRVFLVDGWIAYRRALRLFLEAAGHRVAGEADTVEGATELEGFRTADVVILEPGRDWLELERDLTTLRRAAPAAGVVLLSSEPLSTRLVIRAAESGVRACLTKLDHPADLLRAIGAALSEDFILLPSHLLAKTITHLAQVSTSADQRSAGPRLTRREREILGLAAASYSNRRIAHLLWVTDRTVRFHLDNVFRKLGVKTRADAVAAAKRLGLLGWEWGEPV